MPYANKSLQIPKIVTNNQIMCLRLLVDPRVLIGLFCALCYGFEWSRSFIAGKMDLKLKCSFPYR